MTSPSIRASVFLEGRRSAENHPLRVRFSFSNSPGPLRLKIENRIVSFVANADRSTRVWADRMIPGEIFEMIAVKRLDEQYGVRF
jgi:hypothetical protein